MSDTFPWANVTEETPWRDVHALLTAMLEDVREKLETLPPAEADKLPFLQGQANAIRAILQRPESDRSMRDNWLANQHGASQEKEDEDGRRGAFDYFRRRANRTRSATG